MTETEIYHAAGHVALPGLFSPAILNAFYEQMRVALRLHAKGGRTFAAGGPLLSKDSIEVYAHTYPPMLAVLWGLTPRIALVTGCTLLPTYAYSRAYRQKDSCGVHNDRPACEPSLSLTIAYGDGIAWPLSVATRSDPVPRPVVTPDFESASYGSVAMQPGDSILY